MLVWLRADPGPLSSGHVAELTSCAWHPKDSQTFITSSVDSTIRCDSQSSDNDRVADVNGRIWDVENKRKQKTVIVVKSKERGARTKVNACAYSPDGSLIGGGTFLPSLHNAEASLNMSIQLAWTALCTCGKRNQISCDRV